MTYDNSHPDRRRYGNRRDEQCGSWRQYGPPVKHGTGRGRRVVCTRPFHPDDPYHYDAAKTRWWTRDHKTPQPWPPPANPTTRANTPNPGAAMTDQPTGLTIPEMTERIRRTNIALGWRLDTPGAPAADGRTFGDDIALLTEELGEATSAYRVHGLTDATTSTSACEANAAVDMCTLHKRHLSHCRVPQKPEGVGSELADVIIRVLDTADRRGIDLDFEIARKMTYNETRPWRHGGKRL